MERRRMLKLLLQGGAALGAIGAGRYLLLPPPRRERLGSVDDLARDLFASLDVVQRERACVDYDHPYRQYHNRGVRCGGMPMNTVLMTSCRQARSSRKRTG